MGLSPNLCFGGRGFESTTLVLWGCGFQSTIFFFFGGGGLSPFFCWGGVGNFFLNFVWFGWCWFYFAFLGFFLFWVGSLLIFVQYSFIHTIFLCTMGKCKCWMVCFLCFWAIKHVA